MRRKHLQQQPCRVLRFCSNNGGVCSSCSAQYCLAVGVGGGGGETKSHAAQPRERRDLAPLQQIESPTLRLLPGKAFPAFSTRFVALAAWPVCLAAQSLLASLSFFGLRPQVSVFINRYSADDCREEMTSTRRYVSGPSVLAPRGDAFAFASAAAAASTAQSQPK